MRKWFQRVMSSRRSTEYWPARSGGGEGGSYGCAILIRKEEDNGRTHRGRTERNCRCSCCSGSYSKGSNAIGMFLNGSISGVLAMGSGKIRIVNSLCELQAERTADEVGKKVLLRKTQTTV